MSDMGAVVPLRATGGRAMAIIPQSVEEVFRLATAVHKSGLAPNGFKTAEQITVAIMHGAEIGLPPMQALQKIAVINGRPSLWGDGLPALLLARGFRIEEWSDGTEDGRGATCRVTRPDGAKIERRFTIGDAKVAGLWGKQGTWKQYPDRMLQMRARGLAARDGAADVLSGLYLAEEAQDIPAEPVRKSSAQAKRDGTTDTFDAIRRDVSTATTRDELDAVAAKWSAELDVLPPRWHAIVADEIAIKADSFSAVVDEAAVLRELERRLDAGQVEKVEAEFASTLMNLSEEGREAAVDMIQAKKGE